MEAADTRTGRAAVIAALKPGDEVLLKYVEQSSDIVSGDSVIVGTDLKVIEVRRLGRSPGQVTATR